MHSLTCKGVRKELTTPEKSLAKIMQDFTQEHERQKDAGENKQVDEEAENNESDEEKENSDGDYDDSQNKEKEKEKEPAKDKEKKKGKQDDRKRKADKQPKKAPAKWTRRKLSVKREKDIGAMLMKWKSHLVVKQDSRLGKIRLVKLNDPEIKELDNAQVCIFLPV